MEIDDQYIKDKFFSKNGKVIKSRINNMTTEEKIKKRGLNYADRVRNQGTDM